MVPLLLAALLSQLPGGDVTEYEEAPPAPGSESNAADTATPAEGMTGAEEETDTPEQPIRVGDLLRQGITAGAAAGACTCLALVPSLPTLLLVAPTALWCGLPVVAASAAGAGTLGWLAASRFKARHLPGALFVAGGGLAAAVAAVGMLWAGALAVVVPLSVGIGLLGLDSGLVTLALLPLLILSLPVLAFYAFTAPAFSSTFGDRINHPPPTWGLLAVTAQVVAAVLLVPLVALLVGAVTAGAGVAGGVVMQKLQPEAAE